MLTILLVLLIVGLILSVLQLYKSIRDRREHKLVVAERDKLLEQKAALEKEVGVLRESNRSALKVWQSERRRLWAQARDAEHHARDLQEFHLRNEQDLMHELASAHAMVELLMMAVPKGGVIAHPFEVRRIFRPIVQMAKPDTNKQNVNVF